MSEEDKPKTNKWTKKLSSFFLKHPESKADLLDYLAQERILDSQEKSVLDGALSLSNMQVADILIPRSHIVFVKADDNPQDFLPTLIESAHSRFPVFGENSDEVEGVLIAKDLLNILQTEDGLKDFDIKKYLHPVLFATEYTKLYAMLAKFRESRQHMAIIVNEYGGIEGLITLEDILEVLVGDIEDEHDTNETDYITPNKDGSFTIEAVIPVEEFNDYFNLDFPDDRFDTLGGIIMHKFGHLPHKGETLELGGMKFVVSTSDNRRLHEVTAIQTNSTNQTKN